MAEHGSVLPKIHRGVLMIFVTLGTQKFPFDRLLRKVDELCGQGKLSGVFAQTGHSLYTPKNYEDKQFLSANEFDSCMEKADLVISHGGEGSLLTALQKGKRVVAVPRDAKFGEHVDGHQFEIVQAFAEMDYLEACLEMERLEESIERAKTREFAKYQSRGRRIVEIVEDFLEGGK
jgi:UDP-N-acetylglucosamine transferase subunit ALG13